MIYFIQCGRNGPIKIGRADRPHVRLRTLQSGNPYKLYIRKVISGERSKEQEIIDRFRHSRIRLEWFELTPELLNFMQTENAVPDWDSRFERDELHPCLGKDLTDDWEDGRAIASGKLTGE